MSGGWRLLGHEARVLLRSRSFWLAWALLIACGFLALLQGRDLLLSQQALMAQLPELQQTEQALLEQRYQNGTDAGNVGYYLFLPTSHPPSSWAALAVGLRDSLPVTMKVRLLGLYSQLFDAELVNPLTAAAGPFDFAFFILFIVPVWLIVLSHGLLARDREDGTAALLQAQGGRVWQLLWIRLGLRVGLALLAVLLLLLAGLVWLQLAADQRLFYWLVLTLGYIGFWSVLCALIVALRRSSAWSLLMLLVLWALLTLVAPAAVSAWVDQRYPVADAPVLQLKQREVVHTGWDLPKETTFARFFQTHPEWSETAPVTERFHWKWYYAMHQVGDDSIAAELTDYRDRLEAREAWVRRLGYVVPVVGMQRGFAGVAQTDLADHLHYQDSIKTFHDQLRAFFYPYLFNDRPFELADFARIPSHQWQPAPLRSPWGSALGMLAWIALGLVVSQRLLRRQ